TCIGCIVLSIQIECFCHPSNTILLIGQLAAASEIPWHFTHSAAYYSIACKCSDCTQLDPGFDSHMGRCWLLGAGAHQGAQCSSVLSPEPFCVEFACSPRVHKGFPPLRTPTEKTCKITEHMSIPDQRWTVHFTWSPGATSC